MNKANSFPGYKTARYGNKSNDRATKTNMILKWGISVSSLELTGVRHSRDMDLD